MYLKEKRSGCLFSFENICKPIHNLLGSVTDPIFQNKNQGHRFAQSICTYYSSVSGRPDIFLGYGTLKKNQNMGCKNRVQKTRAIVIQKEKRPCCLFSFWIKITHLFCSLLFCNPFFGPFFQGQKPTHVFKTRIVGADWLGYWLDEYESETLLINLTLLGTLFQASKNSEKICINLRRWCSKCIWA